MKARAILLMLLLCNAAHAAVDEGDILALQKSAESGNRAAIWKLFSAYPETDGAVTEDIDMILGNVARRYPRALLEELQRSDAGHGKCTNLGNTLELVDQTQAQIAELRARKQALLSVTDAPLKALRDDCAHELDKDIKVFTDSLAEKPKHR